LAIRSTLSVGRTYTACWYDRAQAVLAMSCIGCTSRKLSSWNVSAKLLPT